MRAAALPVDVADEIAHAMADGGGVVALETSIIAQGLPRSISREVATAMEHAVRAAGAVPGFTAVVAGAIRCGLSALDLDRLASEPSAKASARDLASLAAQGIDGATTVAGTLRIARAVGARVMATGGIGGVHPSDRGVLDVSADLDEIASVPALVVCSGAKSLLDLPQTLEWLEMRSVPVLGWRTDRFPAFLKADSGLAVPAVEDFAHVVELARRHWTLGGGGVLLAQPAPAALDGGRGDVWTDAALRAAAAAGVAGGALTPFVLAEMARLSDGATVQANRELAVANAALAGRLAAALAELA